MNLSALQPSSPCFVCKVSVSKTSKRSDKCLYPNFARQGHPCEAFGYPYLSVNIYEQIQPTAEKFVRLSVLQ